MSNLKSSKFSLEALINIENKVLFAEANGHVVNVLLRFLTMPLGRIVKFLEELSYVDPPVIGCVTALYEDLMNQDNFSVGEGDQLLFMGSTSLGSQCRRIVHDFRSSSYNPREYFCQNSSCPFSGAPVAVACYSIRICAFCQEPLVDGRGGVLMVEASSSFVISDDLHVAPVGTKSLLTVSNLGITDTGGAERRSLSFRIDDVVELLRQSLVSPTPLTGLMFDRSKISSVMAKHELHQLEGGDTSSFNMILKVSLQKSTNRFLFADATEAFVQLLYSFLTLPLGGVQSLLGGKTGLVNLDNLYGSVVDGFDDALFWYPDTKKGLIDPNMDHFLKQYEVMSDARDPLMFIVLDDLAVVPFSVATSVLILNAQSVPLSDVKEMELYIGLEEVLRILKASLTSRTALTDAIIKPMLDREMATVTSPTHSESDLFLDCLFG